MSAPSSGGASRDGYGAALLELANDPRVVVLEADLGKSTKSCLFRAEHPERTVSLGIAEQNMVSVAAGLASCGKVPFASTFAIFSERAFEQVRNGVARPGLVAHLCGSHGGIHTGTDGSSAQSIEDLAIYRTIPGMTVMHPCDDLSAKELTMQLLNHKSPSYTRTARNKTPRMYDENTIKELKIGKASILREGDDIAIIACGVMVHKAVTAANNLSKEGIHAYVVDMHTIKPLDAELINQLASTCKGIVTVEDHSIIGGLGSSISEYLSTTNPTKITMIGVEDRFGESGESEELLELVGLTVERIEEACRVL
ncbi:MAG TPA: transketolase C-terminal domain-containing protein [Candidatus Thalassarchaeaceae archaeon]|jgi:transketolase|nr:transketolase C-terminal domain-containing protein [Candidatus Thalassarchaeaceae archaeon]MDP7658806.1 transketolase C-terminal domain-containing protein [Candidatus Thalassarchaeaceae archaeon]HJO42468.1 transketolase C-terminal domain-containing protein [Candidatus Thalassarchaeaceae archaeon]|tara:strand:+ start:1598 stop:2533 length:936 start_codon:yes stop_codon:yes gene_type:complete